MPKYSQAAFVKKLRTNKIPTISFSSEREICENEPLCYGGRCDSIHWNCETYTCPKCHSYSNGSVNVDWLRSCSQEGLEKTTLDILWANFKQTATGFECKECGCITPKY